MIVDSKCSAVTVDQTEFPWLLGYGIELREFSLLSTWANEDSNTKTLSRADRVQLPVVSDDGDCSVCVPSSALGDGFLPRDTLAVVVDAR